MTGNSSSFTLVVKIRKGGVVVDSKSVAISGDQEFSVTLDKPTSGFDCGGHTIDVSISGTPVTFYSNSYQYGQNYLLQLPITMENSGCP